MFVYLQATPDDYSFWNLVMGAPLVVKALILVLVVMMLVAGAAGTGGVGGPVPRGQFPGSNSSVSRR